MSEKEPVKTTVDSVASHIELLIASEGLTPSARIPSERQLAHRLGVSRSVIREALHQLQGKGIIDTQQGRGSYVRCLVGEESQNRQIELLLDLGEQSLHDLLEVREQLEGQAAFLAAQRANQGDRYRIERAYAELSGTEWNADSDHAFHQSILEACHNPVLVHTLASLKKLTLHSVRASVKHLSDKPEFATQIDKQHKQIFNAVISGQADWARRSAVGHVRFIMKSLDQLEQTD